MKTAELVHRLKVANDALWPVVQAHHVLDTPCPCPACAAWYAVFEARPENALIMAGRGDFYALGSGSIDPSAPSAAPTDRPSGTSTPTARDSMVARPSAPPADRPSADLSEDDAPEQPEPPCAECEDGWVFEELPGYSRCIAKSRCEKCNALEE